MIKSITIYLNTNVYFCPNQVIWQRNTFYAVLEGKDLHSRYRLFVLHEYLYHLEKRVNPWYNLFVYICMYTIVIFSMVWSMLLIYCLEDWSLHSPEIFYMICLTTTISGYLPSLLFTISRVSEKNLCSLARQICLHMELIHHLVSANITARIWTFVCKS